MENENQGENPIENKIDSSLGEQHVHDTPHTSGSKNLAFVLVALVIIAVAGMLIFKPMPKVVENPIVETPDTKLTILEKVDKKVSVENAKVSINVTYPEFANVPVNINAEIKDFVDNEVAMIESLVAEGMPDSVVTSYFLEAKYEIEQANTDYVSLVFTVNEDTGGAHPNQFFRTFNFDAKTGLSITLQDLFPANPVYFMPLRAKIKTAVHDELTAVLSEQGDNVTNPDDLLFEDISKLKEDVFNHYTFGTNYIRFFFSPYDIAPYAFGPIVVKVDR